MPENTINTRLPAPGVMRDESGPGFRLGVHLDYTNERLRVLSYQIESWGEAAGHLDRMAQRHEMGKILFNVREKNGDILGAHGYVLEGMIPGFFHGEGALCFSRFVRPERAHSDHLGRERALLEQVLARKEETGRLSSMPEDCRLSLAAPEDAERLALLYQQVFSSYPTPLPDPDYIREIMGTHAVFAAVFAGNTLISAASAEMDEADLNAEITDCATLPSYRGRGLLTHIISSLEREMSARGIPALYSLARAGSFGMNAVLHKLGYEFRGTFINNCHIGGRFEDMNLWTKKGENSSQR